MSFATIKLLGFAPDLPTDTPGAITSQQGMIPSVRGFTSGPVQGISQTASLGGNSLGVFSPKQVNGTRRYFIGTATKLWESNSTGSSLTDRSLTAYSASATQTWSFCQFGDITLASNLGNAIGQINANAAFATVTGGGTPPKASIIINAGPATAPFVLAFNYDDGSVHADGLFNSGLADYTGWTVGTNQCATLRAYEPSGPFVAAIAYRDGAIAFKENAMFEVTYSAVAATPGWSFRRIASDIGCSGKNMCVNVNDTIYFADKRGFWMYDGSYPKKLPGYLHDFWSINYATTGCVDDSCQVVWDPTRHNLWVSHRLSASSTTNANWLVWNQLSGLWARQTTISNGTVTPRTTRQIITFEAAPLVTTIDGTAWTVDTFSYDVATHDDTHVFNPPLMKLWYIGDAVGYTEVMKLAPVWMGLNVPSALSTAYLYGYKRQGISPPTQIVGPNLIDDNGLFFDIICSNNWILPQINAYGAYEFGSVGISSTPSGQRGTR